MNARTIISSFLAAAAALAILACSSAASNAPSQNPVTGQHPADWQQTHYVAFLKDPASCSPCHGSSLDPTIKGTSSVTCFGCHHPNGPNHPTGWGDRTQHGRNGAQLPAGTTDFSMQGFASCTPCHGSDYNSPVGTTTPSCYACHTHAPHPNAPWGATNPPPDPTTSASHDHTDPSNAPECYKCHALGSSHNPIVPVSPAPAGTAPGCFNGTMCHNKQF